MVYFGLRSVGVSVVSFLWGMGQRMGRPDSRDPFLDSCLPHYDPFDPATAAVFTGRTGAVGRVVAGRGHSQGAVCSRRDHGRAVSSNAGANPVSSRNGKARGAVALLTVLLVVVPAAARACWGKHGAVKAGISKGLHFKSSPENLPNHEKSPCRLEDCTPVSVPSQTLSALWNTSHHGHAPEAPLVRSPMSGPPYGFDVLNRPAVLENMPSWPLSSPEACHDSLLC